MQKSREIVTVSFGIENDPVSKSIWLVPVKVKILLKRLLIPDQIQI